MSSLIEVEKIKFQNPRPKSVGNSVEMSIDCRLTLPPPCGVPSTTVVTLLVAVGIISTYERKVNENELVKRWAWLLIHIVHLSLLRDMKNLFKCFTIALLTYNKFWLNKLMIYGHDDYVTYVGALWRTFSNFNGRVYKNLFVIFSQIVLQAFMSM